MPADIYQAQDPEAGLTPGPSPQAPTEGYQAMVQTGNAGDNLAFRWARARDATVETQAATQLALGANALRQKYAQDTDFATAPDRYAQDFQEMSRGVIGDANTQLSGEGQARLAHNAAMLSIAGGNEVNQAAVANEKQTNVANWQAASQQYASMFVNAKSDAERDAAMLMASKHVTTLTEGGWINPEQAGKELQAFAQGAQSAYVAKVMQTDPAAAKAMLADPDNPYTKNIPQPQRVALLGGAQAAVDETGQLKLSILAKTDPAAAGAAVGRIAPNDAVTANQIFLKGVVQQESDGNPNAISPAGALGLSQLMPGTARAMAAELGMRDVAGMSDEDLRTRLLSDKALNIQLGQRYFQQQVNRYGGYIPAALAAYNAGPARADEWIKQASAKFGNDPTPEQFASVVGISETKDYISKVYGYLGAPTNAFGLSGNAVLRGQSTVIDVGRQEAAAQQRMLSEGASLARSSDPVTQVLQDGYAVDPQRLMAYRQTQAVAAAGGDAGAAQELRRVDAALAQGPVMRAAYQMTPENLAATVASKEQALAQSPNVTADQIAELKTLKTVQAAMDAAKSTNTIGLGERQGMFRSTPVLASDIGTPAFANALAARGPQTLDAAQAYDGNIVPLKPEEASALKTAWGQMGPADKAGLAATMAANLKDPRVYAAAMKQIVGDNRIDLTAGLIAGDNPDVARRVLVGADMLKEKGVEAKVPAVREAMAQLVPENLYPTFDSKSDLVQAALANYAAKQGGNGVMIDPNDRAGQLAAMEEVSGRLATVNGRVTPVPRTASLAEFSTVLHNVTASDLKAFGGVQPGISGPAPMGGTFGVTNELTGEVKQFSAPEPASQEDRDAAYVAKTAQLMPMGLGSTAYQVLDRRGLAIYNAQGAPLRVDYNQLRGGVLGRMKAAERERLLKVNEQPDVSPMDHPADFLP